MQLTVIILISLSLIALYINYNNKDSLTIENEIYNDKDSFLNDYVKKKLEVDKEEVNEYQGKKLVDKDGKMEIVEERPIKDVYRIKTDKNTIYGVRKQNKEIYEENSKGNGLNYGVLNGIRLNNDPFDAGTDVAVGPEQITDVVSKYNYGIEKGKKEYELLKNTGSTDGTVSLADVKSFDGKQTFKYMTLAKEQIRNATENEHKNFINILNGQNSILVENNSKKINPNNTPDMHNYKDPVELNNNDVTRRKESIIDPRIDLTVLGLSSMINRKVLREFS